MRDLHSVISPVQALAPAAAGATGTGRTGNVIDRKGFDSLEFIIEYGAVTATNATLAATLLECSTSNGTFTSVADSDMLPASGTPEALAGIGAGTPRTAGVNSAVSKKIGYIGSQRYIKLKVVSTVSAGVIVGATAILGNPQSAPV